MEPTKYTVRILKHLLKERGVKGYSGKRKAKLIVMLQASKPHLPHPTRRASPPPRSKKPPKKKIKQLERKKRNLKSWLWSNPKLQEQLRGEAWERSREPPPKRIPPDGVPESKIDLIENQIRVKTHRVTGPLNHDVSNLILDTIGPVIEMRMRVIYSFSCTIYRGWNQVVQYHRTLSPNVTFTSLSQIEEYIKQCKLSPLNLDNEEVSSKAYLPAVRITDNHRVYEGRVKLQHIQVQLILSKEPLLGCGPLPSWLGKQRCIYTVNNRMITCVFGDF